MATYVKLDSSKDVNFARATVGRSGNVSGVNHNRDNAINLDAVVVASDAVADGRYKYGGTTTWERPGQA